MNPNQLHFAHPLWLYAGLIVPLVWMVFFLFYRKQQPFHQLENFIDSHLLPYLLINKSNKEKSIWKTLILWSLVWCGLTLALAGPRWNFREMETFSQDQSLVILLDLSESMNATDIKPSRLIRAKQKIEDLLNISKGVKIGLIAFAADPHMITPITDDKETIRHLLPSLDTELVYVQGSRLSSAFDMAANMLDAEAGSNKALLVISDGGFEDASAIIAAKKLAEKGIVIHVMGVGTAEGAPLANGKKNKSSAFSKLERERLNEISKVANGRYLEAHYSDHEEAVILNDLEKRANAQMNIGKKKQFWDEQFYLMILPILPIILWWFRRGYIFAAILILFAPTFELSASGVYDYFKNSEERGKQALEEEKYEEASHAFQDPYRKGVAYYKAKNFVEAEQMFRQSTRLEVASNAQYNLGNALVQQQKLKEAIVAYEEVLKNHPEHTKAKENLELVKKMLEQQKQEGSDSENSDQQEEQKDSDKKDQKENQGSKGSDQKEQSQEDQKQQGKEDSGQQEKGDKEKPQDTNGGDSDSGASQEERMKDQQESHEANNEESEGQLEEGQTEEKPESDQKESREVKAQKSQEDQDADLWLNQIVNDPKTFLKNKFYIESKKNGTKEGIDPW